MIEILQRQNVHKIQDIQLKEYIQYSLDRLSNDFELPECGYFVVIENYDELKQNPIQLTYCVLPSIENEDFINSIEIVETSKNQEIIEIIFILNNDFSISLVLHNNILPSTIKNRLLEFSF
jgi:hypothetical protein